MNLEQRKVYMFRWMGQENSHSKQRPNVAWKLESALTLVRMFAGACFKQ